MHVEERLTAGIRADLPVVVKWSTTREDGYDGGQEGPQDQKETDLNANAIVLAKTILSFKVSDKTMTRFESTRRSDNTVRRV
jgi:hypothetical protein